MKKGTLGKSLAFTERVLRHWRKLAKSDYIERERIEFADGFYLTQPQKWYQVIELAYGQSDELVRSIALRRYLRRESHVHTAMELSLSDRSYYSLLDDFRTTVALAAVQAGLLKIF